MKKITFLIIITTSILSCNSSTKEQPSRNTNLTTAQIDSIIRVHTNMSIYTKNGIVTEIQSSY